jgi:transcriptional regulator with XRE-family HTH domain
MAFFTVFHFGRGHVCLKEEPMSAIPTIQIKQSFAERMQALGLAPTDLAKLCGISQSQASQIANGRKPHAAGTELVDRWLSKCEELARKAYPIPIDWRSTQTVRDVMTLIRTDQLKIEIETGEKKSMEEKSYPPLPSEFSGQRLLKLTQPQFDELEELYGLEQLAQTVYEFIQSLR